MEILHELITDISCIKLFKIPVYDSNICFIRYNNDISYNEVLIYLESINVNIDDYKTDDYKNAYGFTFKEKSKLGVIHFIIINGCEEYSEYYKNTLTHEIFHLISHICKHHGIEMYPDSDNEHIAYLTGYLSDILLKF